MAGSTLGTLFKITTWGESHGKGVGVVIDGCPAGLSLCEADIQKFLDRRKPGQSRYATPRKEDDAVEILSGVFEGKTTVTPISLVVFNRNQQSKDYSEIASYYRPGHADYTFDQKYGFRDYRGGGRSSGRGNHRACRRRRRRRQDSKQARHYLYNLHKIHRPDRRIFRSFNFPKSRRIRSICRTPRRPRTPKTIWMPAWRN